MLNAKMLLKTLKFGFISPEDGDFVDSEFDVIIGSRNVAIGSHDNEDNAHHHIIIDRDDLMAEFQDEFIPPPLYPGDLHLNDGEEEYTLLLPPGEHTLQLMIADHNHIPHYPAIISRQITITVE